MRKAVNFGKDWGLAIGVAIFASLAMFWAASTFADDCRPPLPAGAPPYCASLQDTDCTSNPINAGWKISNKASAAEVCAYLKANPHQEHRYYVFRETLHCNMLGGSFDVATGRCNATRGVFSSAPYLPAIMGEGGIGRASYCCASKTGIPPRILAHLQDKEWVMQDCPNYSSWTVWPPHGNALAVRGVTNEYDVPASCYNWRL